MDLINIETGRIYVEGDPKTIHRWLKANRRYKILSDRDVDNMLRGPRDPKDDTIWVIDTLHDDGTYKDKEVKHNILDIARRRMN